ncbi:response regulator [Metapseudomonas resinovorans]|uniref:Two-component response regulator n=1 Tax=Metapseudomonas resinovorans NBRC 106553 TaxID=1245471 RepID=S6AW30_METRE|nr:response regulator [Pseudomonas resinovorans]BAN48731.1 hypothetical protein PCA10_29990 [Pseudomonas resinovorans NBRC 106553]
MARVLLVDSLPIVRDGLRALVARCGHEVAGETDNGQDALSLCRELHPDIVILELVIPRLGGLDVLRRLRGSAPQIRLLVFSAQESEVYAGRALQAGADAFVGKQEPASELEKALAAVVRGRTYFPQQAVHTEAGAGTGAESELERLSARELTVLQMLCQGLSNKDISLQLNLSYKTVSTYKFRLHQKLGVSSDFQLIAVARTSGLVIGEAPGDLPTSANPETMKELELLHALLDTSSNPMFVRDTESRLLLCNRAYLERTGLRFEDVRGTRIEDAHWLSADRRQTVVERYREAVRRGEPFMRELSAERLDAPGALYAWCVPYHNQAGEVVAMVGGLRSLVERDNMLAELRHESLEARHRSQLKSQLLATVNHRLREQLEELRHCLLATQQSSQGQTLLDELARTLARIDEMLALDGQALAAHGEAHDLGPLTGGILASLRTTLVAKGFELELGSALQALPRAWIDATRYRRLLEGLLEYVMLAQAPARVLLGFTCRPHLRGLLRLSIELTPWPVAEDGSAAPEAAWAHAHVQQLLAGFEAQSRIEGTGDARTLKVELNLPVALDP